MIGHKYPTSDLAESPTMISEAEYARQKISRRLRFLFGEWFLDQNLGVPWIESILVKNPDLRYVQGVLRDVIASVPGITAVQATEASLDRDTRHLTIVYQAIYKDATIVQDVLTSIVAP